MAYLFYRLIIVFFVFSSTTFATASSKETTLKLPPKSISDWYKPKAKRQTWLHNMFMLRRSMQAIREYEKAANQELLSKWTKVFVKAYSKMGEMVPEWKGDLLVEEVKELEKLSANVKMSKLAPVLKKIGKNCNTCHESYQASTALIYRSADFEDIGVKNSLTGRHEDYYEQMAALSDAVNHVKIAYSDGYFAKSISGISVLRRRLKDLSSSCEQCHKNDNDPSERIFGTVDSDLNRLKSLLEQKKVRDAGMLLGGFAVRVCARCHGVHKNSSDLKTAIMYK